MTYKFSNNVSTLLYEEIGPNASEMKVRKLPEGIRWPVINAAEKEVAPCTVIDPRTRAWEIMYIKEIIEGPTYDTLKITRGEEETGPNSFSKNSRVEIRVTAAVLNDYYSMQVATPTRKGIIQVGNGLGVTTDGILSVPVATDKIAGAVKVGDNIDVGVDGTVSIPSASTTKAGVVKLSDNFVIDEDGNLSLPVATTTETGVIKVGDRLLVNTDGTLSAPLASDTVEGMVRIGEGLEFDSDGALVTSVKELPVATDEDLGVIKVGTNLTIDEDGKLSADAETIVQSQIDDTQVSDEHLWSSSKIHEELTTNSSSDSGGGVYNSEEWITESGTWVAPVTGWYHVLVIGGGDGSNSQTTGTSGGNSGGYWEKFVNLTSGEEVPVVIGAGGLGATYEWPNPSPVNQYGGETTFGDVSSNGATEITGILPGAVALGNTNTCRFWGPNYHRMKSTDFILRAIGGGLGGGRYGTNVADCSATFFGGGGGSMAHVEGTYGYGNGAQGVVRVRWYDPTKF